MSHPRPRFIIPSCTRFPSCPVTRQLAGLGRRLSAIGAEVDSVPTGSDGPYLRDRVAVWEGTSRQRALVFRDGADASGWIASAQCFADRGWDVSIAPPGVIGTELVLIDRLALLRVPDVWTRRVEHRMMARDLEVVEIPLNARFPSLDAAIGVLDDGAVFYCPDALGPCGERRLRELLGGDHELVPVPLSDALAGGLRWAQAGAHVLLGHGAPMVMALLARRGLTPESVPLDRAQAAGRSASCAAVRVWPSESVTERVAA